MMPVSTGFLASVANQAEADLAARHGVDIIDLKNPGEGVLGAVGLDTARAIVTRQRASHPQARLTFSATIGDLFLRPASIETAIARTAASGVDIVKIGWFSQVMSEAMLPVLRRSAERGIRVVVVLFAEYGLQTDYLTPFADAGVHGVMLDTADKTSGTLRHKLTDSELAAFIECARHRRLIAGLAGSLRRSDIGPLLDLAPDYLGFRGALCSASQRTAGLDGEAVESVRLFINSRAGSRAQAS